MAKIKFLRENKTVEVEPGTNLRKVALKEGAQLYAGVHKVLNCQGFGQCCSCKVIIKKGAENVSSQGWVEWFGLMKHPLAFFHRLGNEKELRLACQTRVNGDIEVETQPEMNWHGDHFWG